MTTQPNHQEPVAVTQNDKALEHEPMWRSIGALLGARLTGWSYDYSASFVFPKGETLQIGREMKEALLSISHAPSQHSELADRLEALHAKCNTREATSSDSFALRGSLVAALPEIFLALRQPSPNTVRRDAWKEAAKVASDIGISIDQISAWQNLSKLQFGNEVAQHISSEISALATKQGEPE